MITCTISRKWLELRQADDGFEFVCLRQDKGNGLASTGHEFTDCFEIFSVEIGRGPQGQTLRTGNEFVVPS